MSCSSPHRQVIKSTKHLSQLYTSLHQASNGLSFSFSLRSKPLNTDFILLSEDMHIARNNSSVESFCQNIAASELKEVEMCSSIPKVP